MLPVFHRIGSMRPITVSVELSAPVEVAWQRFSDLSSHSQWMSDAVSILFNTAQRRGVGVEMTVPTRVGPIRVTDIMEVVEWVEMESIGVRHTGRIRGRGRFELSDQPGGSRLVLTEHLKFPWYLGGAITGLFARPILRRTFRANLRRFKRWMESERL